MAGETVTRAHLSEALYEEVGLSRNECAELVDTVLREISDTLTKGEAVKISSFGSFSVRQKGERIGRNPKTGEEAPILLRHVVVFRASNVLKSRVNSALRNVGYLGYSGRTRQVSLTSRGDPEPAIAFEPRMSAFIPKRIKTVARRTVGFSHKQTFRALPNGPSHRPLSALV